MGEAGRTRPKRCLQLAGLLVVVALAGCGVAAPTPAATATATATATAAQSRVPAVSPSPTATSAAGDGETVVAADAFDSLDAWDATAYVYAPWSLDAGTGGESPPSAAVLAYLNDQSSRLGTTVRLPDTTPITLRYRAWYETEAGRDELITWVGPVGGSDLSDVAIQSGSSGGQFVDVAVDLTRWAGRDVQLVFEFRSDQSTAILGGGVRIDDVLITTGGAGAPAGPDATPGGGQDIVTAAQCGQVRIGDPLEDVDALLGTRGTQTGALGIGADRITYYEWRNGDGSSMVLGIKGGLVDAISCP